MAIIGGGESCFEETQTLSNQQPVTLDQFLTLLNEFRKEMGLPPKKDTFDDTVSQNLNETMYLKEELKPEKETPLQDFVQSVERGRKDSPYEKDLQLFNLKETFPELLTLQKAIFKIKKKIGKGTLQFLYKNGLFNLFKESCAVFNEQDIDDTQYQMENPDFVINADGGIKLRKKPRKKVKRKKKEREKGKRWI